MNIYKINLTKTYSKFKKLVLLVLDAEGMALCLA